MTLMMRLPCRPPERWKVEWRIKKAFVSRFKLASISFSHLSRPAENPAAPLYRPTLRGRGIRDGTLTGASIRPSLNCDPACP
jgi:hypothetical protein